MTSSKKDFVAAIKDRAYWDDRAQKAFKTLDNSEKHINANLRLFYAQESVKLDKEIARYYARYGKDNVIQYRNLLKQLPYAEQQLLIRNIDKFIKLYPEHKHLKAIRESVYKLDRLQGLQASIYIQQLEIAAKEDKEVRNYLVKVYEKEFTDVSKDFGHGTVFNTVNKNVIDRFVGKPWVEGMNFSQRIYRNRDKIAAWVNKTLRDGLIQGKTYKELSKELCSKFTEVSMKNAERLVATEGCYVMNEASAYFFESMFEEYEYNSIIDRKTSLICRRLDGQVFKMKDRQAGVNFPPMHPRCRSSFSVVVPSDYIDLSLTKAGL